MESKATVNKIVAHDDGDETPVDVAGVVDHELREIKGSSRRRRRLVSYVNKLSSRETQSLAALCDTFLPAVKCPMGACDARDAGVEYDELVRFFNTSAAVTGTPDHIGGLISQRLGHHVVMSRLALWMLSSSLGTLIMGGRAGFSSQFPYVKKFSRLPLEKRQRILLSWSLSWFWLYRMAYTGTKLLIFLSFFTHLDEEDNNPSWKAIGYCGPDPEFVAERKARLTNQLSYLMSHEHSSETEEEQLMGPLHKGLINIKGRSRESIAESLRQRGFHVTVSQKKSRPSLTNPSLIIHCDAVVVGSGSGGGVIAGVLAKAGYRVLVLEKGSYRARSNLSLLEGPTLDEMYEGAGMVTTTDLGITILAGSTVGGGSTVNWSASIRTPKHVLKEWCQEYELELFGSKLYRDAMDVVCEKMQVQPVVGDEGLNNAVLRKGCEELGYPVNNIPRNATSDHYCGWCCLGCKDGRKKGTLETWLKDMVDSENGVILPNCEAIRVLHRRKKGRTRNTATGVAFQFIHEGVTQICVVESKVTIAAGGTLNTPVLLKKSGLKNNNIGKNLHLHPVTMAWGYFPETDPTIFPNKKSYEGGIMTSMSTVASNFDTTGYGTVLQTPSLHPGLFAALMPWTSGTDIKLRMSRFSRTAHLIAIARDKSCGTISTSCSSRKIKYTLKTHDKTNLKKGIESMLRILEAAGAQEIGTHHVKGEKINVRTASSRDFEQFVKRESSRNLKGLSCLIASAHQMSSCRMGIDPRSSAVNQMGETWEIEGLFVGDASVLPTALGVNPMVTVMAIAYCTAQSVLQMLDRKCNNK